MLSIQDLSIRFGAFTAITGISLEVPAGEVLCLLGPSGSGKSTLLRTIAGLERPATGSIRIADTLVCDAQCFVEPEQRRVGMVFQDYALFPHLTVLANAAFGLPRRDRASVHGLLDRLGLSRHATSYPHMLSGGEQQRLALARAMAPRPRILLMDEPFSSLDAQLRDEVRLHTLNFLRESGTTALIVTHDPGEAISIADRIALLDAGRLMQCGTPAEIGFESHALLLTRRAALAS